MSKKINEAHVLDFQKEKAIHEIAEALRNRSCGLVEALLEELKRCPGSNEASREDLGLSIAGKLETEKEERRYRDSLPRGDRIKFVLKGLKERDLFCYSWRLQEQALRMVRDGTPMPKITNVDYAESLEFVAGVVRERLEGCDEAFRIEVIDLYIQDILPGKKVEQEAEEAQTEACDKLLAAVNGKTPDQIKALAEQITASA